MIRYPWLLSSPCPAVERLGPLFLLLLLLLFLPSGEMKGQDVSRMTLLDSARLEFDDAASIRLLVQAANPGSAPVDSLWAVSVHELAFALVRTGNVPDAELWLRWSARHAADWPLDRIYFPPEVVEIWDRATVDLDPWGEPSSGDIVASWEWSGAVGTGAPGRVQVETPVLDGVVLTLTGPSGLEDLSLGLADRDLAPGTYGISLAAQVLETSAHQIEILPGVVTRLRMDPTPIYPVASREEAEGRLARIEWGGGLSACVNGVVMGGGRVVVTPLSGLGTRNQLRVILASGDAISDLSVTEADELRDLAVIRLGGRGAGLEPSVHPELPGHAWAPHHQGCEAPRSEWTRLSAGAAVAGTVGLLRPLPPGATGAPLVSLSGSLVGMVMGSSMALYLEDDDPAIARALGQQVAGAQQIPSVRRAGLPWKWIGAGVALAGVGAALAGGNGDPEPRPTTGTIVIILPGG